MKNLVRGLACATLLLAGVQAVVADDNSSNSSMSSQAKMKDCMAKQKAKDSSMSKDDMKKACVAQMKMDSSHGGTPNQTMPTTQGDPSPATGSETVPATPPK